MRLALIVRLISTTLFSCLAMTAAATTPPPGYVFQETISVPVDGSTISTATALLSGVTYQLRASGTFPISPPPCPLADAEFARFETDNSCALGGTPQDFVGVYDIGVGVNSPIASNAKGITWGSAFSLAHQYTVGFVGTGATLSLNYHDVDYAGNSGSVTVEIFAPIAISSPASTIPTLSNLSLAVVSLALIAMAGIRLCRRGSCN